MSVSGAVHGIAGGTARIRPDLPLVGVKAGLREDGSESEDGNGTRGLRPVVQTRFRKEGRPFCGG
jgi:hypothetical protein